MQNIIIATDLSPYALNTVKVGLAWAKEFNLNAIIVHVDKQPAASIPSVISSNIDDLEQIHDQPIEEELIQSIYSHLKNIKNFRFKLQVWSGVPADGILRAAKESNAKLIVMGLKGQSLFKEILIGSVAQRVFDLSSIPVLGVHEKMQTLPQHPLICCDSVESDSSVFKAAKEIAQLEDIVIMDILHIINPQTVMEIQNRNIDINSLEDALNKAAKFAEENLQEIKQQIPTDSQVFVQTGHIIAPGEQILEHAQSSNNDLIVIGPHGHKGLKRWLMGSTSEYLIKRAERSVYLAK